MHQAAVEHGHAGDLLRGAQHRCCRWRRSRRRWARTTASAGTPNRSSAYSSRKAVAVVGGVGGGRLGRSARGVAAAGQLAEVAGHVVLAADPARAGGLAQLVDGPLEARPAARRRRCRGGCWRTPPRRSGSSGPGRRRRSSGCRRRPSCPARGRRRRARRGVEPRERLMIGDSDPSRACRGSCSVRAFRHVVPPSRRPSSLDCAMARSSPKSPTAPRPPTNSLHPDMSSQA